MASSGCRSQMKTICKNKTTKKEFGDWQTPFALARNVCAIVSKRITPGLVLEPNCGKGVFLQAAQTVLTQAKRCIGLDINPDYVRTARSLTNNTLEIIQGDFFTYDWKQHLDDSLGSILIIGNPPWVTNAELMRIGSLNHPEKTNINGLSGIEAITGKSNFDISEWMLIKEIEALQGKDGLLAMLCKTAIARKVVSFAWKNSLSFTDAEIRRIDAQKYFGVAVDACLLLIRFIPECDSRHRPCLVFDSLDDSKPSYTLGLHNGRIVSQTDVLKQYPDLISDGPSDFCWRSGIKHDCAKVMELEVISDGRFMNGLNEIVDIEHDLLFPLMKSSDLANGKIEKINRFMLVPQRAIGDDTKFIASLYPKTFSYLKSHIDLLKKRKSSIYRNKPEFAIFGVGDYSFAPWKVAISGLYKSLRFRVIGPYEGKPVVFDDTCYFLACESECEARLIRDLLTSDVCSEVLGTLVFWDAKRPITKDILSSIDIRSIAKCLGHEETLREIRGRHSSIQQQTLF